MWSRNSLTERLGLKWPILQAPMGSITTPQLAAAVSDAGGLGGLGMWGFDADDARRRIEGFRQLSAGGLNVNYPLWPAPGELSAAAPEMRARRLRDAHRHRRGHRALVGFPPDPVGAEILACHGEVFTPLLVVYTGAGSRGLRLWTPGR